ncbi:SDR family oxidoreductase [Pseudomonas sp. BIGb0278]|uniref:dTDP-4-dehydrorhamnose reductase family protein n=1 Tax=Pseudomonas sp. BIGb0278 TaxID=2940607 RepID=UPI002169C91D|nr:SDR family oxidoreductase [Pseudomonas sp. BIGb0278]
MRVLILGASGMLGSAMMQIFRRDVDHEVFGTLRSPSSLRLLPVAMHSQLLTNIDVLDQDVLVRTLQRVRPDVVINCVGLIKQLGDAKDPLIALPLNTLFPQKLSRLCGLAGIRLVHISTDCVFSGRDGMYKEEDISDCEDLYGKSKYLGEIHDESSAITLRTSIIGHELNSAVSLVDWFLAQTTSVKGYAKAIFSGLPTVELASIIKNQVLVNPHLCGLYHVAAAPINKFDLLQLVASVYEKSIDIKRDESVAIDRSLDATRFLVATGYRAPSWPELIRKMYNEQKLRDTDLAVLKPVTMSPDA